MTIENWELIRSIIGKTLEVGGLLLTSAGVLGTPRLSRLERFNRKIRRRIKFSVFFHSSRPIIGKIFLFYITIVYITLISLLVFSPTSRAAILPGGIIQNITFLFGITISFLLLFAVTYLLVKYKSPKLTFIAIHEQFIRFSPDVWSESEFRLPKIRIYGFQVSLPFFLVDIIILYYVFLHWISISFLSLVFSITLSVLLFPYKALETFRVKTRLRGSIVIIGIAIGIIGVILD